MTSQDRPIVSGVDAVRKLTAKGKRSTDIEVEELRLRVVAFIDNLLHALENVHRGSSGSHYESFGVSARGRALQVIVPGATKSIEDKAQWEQ